MSSESKDITRVGGTSPLARPGYMEGKETGIESMKQYIVPPRLKIVQKTASDELLSVFNNGDVLITPGNLVVARMGTNEKGKITGEGMPFRFTPVFFFPEWCVWNPIELKDKLPMIRERTVYPNSPIAQKARSQSLRYEKHPDDASLQLRYVEHLNFIIMLEPTHEYGGQPLVMTFCKGEHGSGQRLCSAIAMRKAPMYGCVFEGVVHARSNAKGDWYGLDVRNPVTEDGQELISPWVGEEAMPAYEAAYQEFKKLHADARIRVNLEDDEPSDPAAAPAGKGEF